MFFNKKGSKLRAMLVKIIAVCMSAVTFSLLTGAVIDLQTKQVTLVMVDAFAGSEKTQELTTRQNTVSEFLEENKIYPNEFDRLSMLPEDELYSGARLIIRKSRNFTLSIDGNIEIITTTKKTIREAFEEAGISLGSLDRVVPEADSEVREDMHVSVFRVVNQEVTVDEEIPFESREVSDSSLEKGKTRIKTKGTNGLKRVTYSITTENGVETMREVVSAAVVREPSTQIVAVGTKAKAVKTVKTAGGKSLSYSKKLTVTATAYTAASGKKTASGKVAQYGVIAVDPKVIPLGTKLYVESTDDGKSWKYGYCVAGDTGGAIKGNKIDLYYNSESQCLQFGRRSAIVYVLN